MVGQANAGTPGPPAENIEGYLSFDPGRLSGRGVPRGGAKGVFILRVRGESMIDAHIMDGEYVVAVPEPRTRNGQIVVVLTGEETTLKRFYQVGRAVHLKPANARMAKIIVPASQEVRILGRVVFVFRTLELSEKGRRE